MKPEIEKLKKRIEDKKELLKDMEEAGYEDHQSQKLYRNTKNQIKKLKQKVKDEKKKLDVFVVNQVVSQTLKKSKIKDGVKGW